MITRLLNLFQKKKDERKLFVDIMREFIDKYMSENNLAQSTRVKYETYYNNILLFLAKEKLRDIYLDDIKIKHAEMLRSWLLINLKTCCVRHASRHIEFIKSVLKYAGLMEYCVNDSLSPIRSQRDKPKEIISLELNEIKKLMAYNFHNDILRIVADLFLFQCFTGMSYSDLYGFEVVQKDKREWLYSRRKKTGEAEFIYFFDEAKEIYNKYQGKLPMIANQTYNSYLKQVAGLLNIRKNLTTHIGRKTHATILDEQGASGKTIARQLRNTDRICETTYIAKSHLRTENEFSKLGLTCSMIPN